MAAKDVRFESDAATACARREHLADAVKVTLARKAVTLIDKSFGAPRSPKRCDGCQEIELSDKFENMGAQMVKEVAPAPMMMLATATTTATVLAQAIIKRHEAVAAGMNPDLKRGIDMATTKVVAAIKAALACQRHRRSRTSWHNLGQRRS